MLTAAVRRGLSTPLLVADLPFVSDQQSEEQAVATAHSGAVTVDSVPGRTVFTVHLPALPSEPLPPEPRPDMSRQPHSQARHSLTPRAQPGA